MTAGQVLGCTLHLLVRCRMRSGMFTFLFLFHAVFWLQRDYARAELFHRPCFPPRFGMELTLQSRHHPWVHPRHCPGRSAFHFKVILSCGRLQFASGLLDVSQSEVLALDLAGIYWQSAGQARAGEGWAVQCGAVRCGAVQRGAV